MPAPDPVVAPDPARSDPVEEQALQADDPQAVEAAADAAAADALEDGIRAADDPGQQDVPEPIDEEAEEQAAAAEAAAIGGKVADYAGSEPDEAVSRWVPSRKDRQDWMGCSDDIDRYGAEERTRTFTPLRVQAPEACASANSATSAQK